MFCEEKKSKCPKKKNSKCEEGKEWLSIEFRVFGKKRIEGKIQREDFEVEILRCRKILNLWELKLQLQRKFKIRDFYLLGSYPLVGRHVD